VTHASRYYCLQLYLSFPAFLFLCFFFFSFLFLLFPPYQQPGTNIILGAGIKYRLSNTLFLLFTRLPSGDDKLGVFPLEKAPCLLLYHCSQRFYVSRSFRGGSNVSILSIHLDLPTKVPQRSREDITRSPHRQHV